MRTALKIILEKLGYVVVGTAENGIDAVAKYRDLEPDVVTLDIVMPQMDGVQTLKLLRSVDPNAVVVMVSSLTDQEAGVECAKAGATQYLLKPFDQTKVAEVMQRVAAQRRAA
jgi:two-component system chemotaxis response regulator CheY